ncbi:hypothetical protein EVAR_78655_1 [Eumeta japonica]|uniref:Uncharacterized protein n=1 Tax=Eumeta variegata TaxID=151549 RepID=A0A4C1U845_EUMVA|nr:hypothetical protein EVAR_78655_1 [Eumeta japonica]
MYMYRLRDTEVDTSQHNLVASCVNGDSIKTSVKKYILLPYYLIRGGEGELYPRGLNLMPEPQATVSKPHELRITLSCEWYITVTLMTWQRTLTKWTIEAANSAPATRDASPESCGAPMPVGYRPSHTVQRMKLCSSQLPANDAMRSFNAPRPYLLLPRVPILRHCNAFVDNFTAAVSCVLVYGPTTPPSTTA